MNNAFLQYMTKRLADDANKRYKTLPVITLSRDYGCYGSEIARHLAKQLTETTGNNWRWISKEILHDAAKELRVKPKDISHIFSAKEKGFFLDLMNSFSDISNASDNNIKRAITDVVKTYAEQGNCIIVGRAGCVITKKIKHSLHVKIFAPNSWRVEQIQNRFKLDHEQARKQLEKTDKDRHEFMRFFKGHLLQGELFHATFNRAKLSAEQIANCIQKLAEENKLI